MKREILYRGKRLDNGEWREGYYMALHCAEETLHIIVDRHGVYHRVDPATIGQYTGLVDKNGRKIFEGDILSLRTGRAHEVNYTAGTFYMEGTAIPIQYANRLEVVGNIFDNLELLEEGGAV